MSSTNFNLTRKERVFGLVALLILTISCDKRSQTLQSDGFDSTLAFSNKEIVESDTTPEDIKKFWEVFRQTVILGDTVALKQLVQFPLQTHGVMDSDPQPLIPSVKFYKAFNQTSVEYIRTTSKLTNRTIGSFTEDWFRVSDFSFSKIDGKWKLSLIYFDTRNYY